MAGEVAFIELGTEDVERATRFYSSLFGWQFDRTSGGAGFSGAGVPGGLHPGDPGATPYVFFAVDDIEAAVEKVRALGGTIDEMDVEGDEEQQKRWGRFKYCRDDQGSAFGLHQRPA